ncbi:MAG: hypothetical protein DRO40_11625 [Thermoprotei archaeon]|nr:MAG: hypothetical protein DRO40_11625 [Thermoprotei archaeon]
MDLSLGLRNLRREYLWSNVRVIVLKDHEDIMLPGTTIQLKRGTEITVPRWISKILEEKGVVEVKDTPMNINELGRYSFLEIHARTTSATLQKLPIDFYQKLRDYLEKLKENIARKPSPELVDEYRKARSYVYDILRIRLNRILALVQAGAESGEIRDEINKLTPEELILYKTIRKLLEDWQKEVIGLEEPLI